MRKLRRKFETVSLAEVLGKIASARREKTVVKVVGKEGPYSVHGKDETSGAGFSAQLLPRET